MHAYIDNCFHELFDIFLTFLGTRFVITPRSVMEHVIQPTSMKSATMMIRIVAQVLIKLAIPYATQKMTSKLATMMVGIAV